MERLDTIIGELRIPNQVPGKSVKLSTLANPYIDYNIMMSRLQCHTLISSFSSGRQRDDSPCLEQNG